jgi:sterol desaturase/sphingolipid hydroxylase (fatty acid hydroxylase superfamily)
MAERLLDDEPLVRVIAFSVVLILVSMGEFLRPRRAPTSGSRWRNNIILSAIDAAIVRVILPFGLTGFAVWLQTRGIGVLPAVTDSTLARFLVSCATLDLVVYLQHRLFHAVPALWRFHQVHHSDPDVDATTGVRFHPVEILLSLVLKAAVIAALGAPPLAVLAFEIVLNVGSLLSHANLALPARVDTLLRTLLVTPDMHRIHHSKRSEEQTANFGFNLSWWDRLFSTYRGQPHIDHHVMPLGVAGLEPPRSLLQLLILPWRSANAREAGKSGWRVSAVSPADPSSEDGP